MASTSGPINIHYHAPVSIGTGHAGAVFMGGHAGGEEINLFSVMNPVLDAEWHSGRDGISGCLKGTREGLLEDIDIWRKGGTSTSLLYWLYGEGGTGKSTIMCSACRKYANEKLLGASFFFSRDQHDRSRMDQFFFTLAYRLCRSFPLLQAPITRALKDQGIFVPNLRHQLRELILNPIREISDSLSCPILIVIDALDECEGFRGADAIVEFIDALAVEWEALTAIPMVKFLVASRPHSHLVRVSSKTQVRRNSKVLHLNQIERSIQEADLRTYATHGLEEIAFEYRSIAEEEGWHALRSDWPSRSDVDALLDLAGGLFISVATLLRLLKFEEEEGRNISPQRTLEQLRGIGSQSQGLDRTYLAVLKVAARVHRSPKALRQLRLLLAFIVLSFDRLPVAEISFLLSIKAESFLPALRSVVEVAKGKRSLRALHTSFHDFITDPTRCVGEGIYHIDAQSYHLELAKICLRQLGSLKRDLLDLKDIYQRRLPKIKNTDIQEYIATIPLHWSYSIKFWIAHAILSTPSGCLEDRELVVLMEEFANSRLLYWIEALGYLGHLNQGNAGLRQLLELLPKTCENLRSLFYDTIRLVQEHYAVISVSPMHLYFSALPFAPRETELFRRFGHRERADSISVRSGVAPHWDACLQSIGLDSSVKCIAISQDALSIAAGTEKGPIWLIDAATGAPTHQLQGHTRDLNRGFLGTVLSVAFSPDSYRIVSSSRDRTIRLWDAVLFKQLHILVDDSKLATKASEQRTLPNPVPFAAFSPDGKRIAVRTSDKTRLWDPNNAAGLLLLNTFDTALDRFGPVAFSPDGTCFASGSQHGELELLDVSFGTERLVRFRPHVGEISSLAFSPNGARIVSCSHYSPVIKVWDKISNKELFAMYGHEYGVYSVAFSPDGACIVSGSTDNTIRVWDSVSGNALRMLSGHTSGVTSVAFSPDGRHIISGSDDQTVRIWDSALDGGPIDQLAVRRDRRTSSALDISPDGTRVLSSGHLYEVQLRDGLSGKPLDQFTVGSQGYDVDAVSFSPDGAHFVSLNTVKVTEASDGFKLGTSVQMFDVVSGEQLWVSNISLRATNVAFLDDGRHLEVWPNVSGGTGLSGRKSARLEVSKGLEIFSMTDVLTSEPKRLVNSCFSFEKDKNCIVRLTPLPGSVVCYVPRGFRVSKYCFRGNFGVLALESGEIVILEIPQ